jgi:hypothetical protein
LIGFIGTTEQAAEKVDNLGEIGEIKIAGAEARVDLISFIGTTEVVPFYNTP